MSKLAVLRQCAGRVEAETIRIRLASVEIQALITGTDAGTALGLGGAATSRLVRVEVAREDYERANALLEADELRTQLSGPWVCSRCHEQNEAAFDVCWSCNKMRSPDDIRGRNPDEAELVDDVARSPEQITTPNPDSTSTEDRNPYRPVLLSDSAKPHKPVLPEADSDDQLWESVTRCFRSAIVGMLVLPPLFSFYSLLLLVSLDPIVYRRPRLRKRTLLAWTINLVIVALSLAFWFMI